MSLEIDSRIEKYLSNSLQGLNLLYSAKLYGQMLVLLYSCIDAMGLLDAPPSQIKATGDSFKNWVKKYMLGDPRINFNELDFWAARCAVIHTFTSQSDLSNDNKAKELQYYAGAKDSPQAKLFASTTPLIDGGKHIPVHIEDTYLVFLEALKTFCHQLATNCKNDQAYEKRLNKVLQMFSL